MLLFSERTWKHHCVTLLLPFVVICFGLSSSTLPRSLRVYFGATLGLVGLLMLSTSTGVFAGWDRAGKLAQVYGAYVWTCVLLTAALAVILRQPDEAISRRPALVE